MSNIYENLAEARLTQESSNQVYRETPITASEPIKKSIESRLTASPRLGSTSSGGTTTSLTSTTYIPSSDGRSPGTIQSPLIRSWSTRSPNSYKGYGKYKLKQGMEGSNSAVSQGLSGAAAAMGNMSGNELPANVKGTREAIRSGIAQIPIYGPIIAAASSIVDGIGDVTGLNIDSVDQNAMNKIGARGAGKFGTFMNSLPGNSMLWGWMLNKSNEFTLNPDMQKAGASYSGFLGDANVAEALGGKRTYATKKINDHINKVTQQQNILSSAISKDTARQQNMATQMMMPKLTQIYSGSSNKIKLSKSGGIIPELEAARASILSLQSKKQEESSEPKKFQLGGKMNMIVTGALHARKHNLEELNPNLEGEITKKGIPVVVMNEGGEVQSQQAEVESQELVLQIDTTKTIEDYYDEYNLTNSKTEKNKIALECGKYLVNELLKNTDDPDKLIKKTV